MVGRILVPARLRLRRSGSGLVAMSALAVLLASGAVGWAPAAIADPAPAPSGYIESGSDDPVTPAPDTTRPTSASCSVTLAHNFLSNAPDGSNQRYRGTFTPPAACPGPWAKVILDSSTTVSGRQFDRVGDLKVAGVTIWFGTTQEPAGAVPTTFRFSKDVTRYSALFRSAQSYEGGIENYTTDVYTGNYSQTVTLTFFRADAANPAPSVPDVVKPLTFADLTPAASSATASVALPRNLTSASVETTLKGNGCDEQWFSAVPDAVVSAFPKAGLCGATSYREAILSIDNTPAAAVNTFPHIYSGGIVPTLWRPVLAINTLDLRPETVDITPFVGRLVDGAQHTVSVRLPQLNDRWQVVATLFGTVDASSTQTSGSLVSSSVPDAAPRVTTRPAAGAAVRYQVAVGRNWQTVGWVRSSAGTVYTTVAESRDWRQVGTISGNGASQQLEQRDVTRYRSRSTSGARVVAEQTLRETYPLTVDVNTADYTDDQNFSLTATVSMGLDYASDAVTLGGPRARRAGELTLDSRGVLARAAGKTSASDGSSRTTWRGVDDRGRYSARTITTEHGRVLTDTATPR
ncbi:peptide-N4-asparagine amidase [Williamsia sp. CHRR-6]|uniref:peptide-N4-asparagine amidase n=1 Tax=Williamsia sp. CHRR-6 TaxID=2835871 RepID=UPI001BDAF7AF|nr:peptide-N4-asparagine amidase [Williamsia sp. CHRR-6]MBT0566488.1 hypothetical protein [Williamsia sp. CHRR-6]